MRIGVIGGGISGLAAAYYLSRKHDVWLLEKEHRVGGHTNTVSVSSSQGPLAIDTGFIVHNERTYPHLVRLFRELGVETNPSDMSFAVSCPRTGFEYSSRGLGGYFAQSSNLLRAGHYLLLREILRFNREAPRWLQQPGLDTLTIGEVVEQGKFAPVFLERYLYPMACAVWSMGLEQIGSFPAATLLRFFDNHGMLGIGTHPQWRVVRGGSNCYLPRITAPYKDRVLTGVSIQSATRMAGGIRIQFRERPAMTFDHVVLACHGNQALALLEEPTDRERDILGCFATSRNEVCLHTDSSFLPRRRRARASWNYHIEPDAPGATLTYHMNRLQSLPTPEDYCVTMNPGGGMDPAKILHRFVYHHPVYNRRAVAAQNRWSEISGADRIHYCGAYWFYGFHEDGLRSARRVAQALGAPC